MRWLTKPPPCLGSMSGLTHMNGGNVNQNSGGSEISSVSSLCSAM
ncbi:MAG: hypothetical protein ACK55Z_37385 [bacterium]